MKVLDIMTRPPQTVPLEMTLAAASRRMKQTGCGALAALDQRGRLAGIITDRDLALAIGNTPQPARLTVGTVMSRPVHVCRPGDDVQVALERMALHKVRRLPVVDTDGDVKGLLSIDDIILWSVPKSAVSLPTLVTALRSLCIASTAAIQQTVER